MSPELPNKSPLGSGIMSRSLSASVWLEGLSPAITRVRAQILRAAPHFRMASLLGERDTGEESVARMLHQLSPLRDRHFANLAPADVEVRVARGGSPESLAATGVLYLTHPECFPLAIQDALLLLTRKSGAHTPSVIAFSQRDYDQRSEQGPFQRN